MDGTKIQELRLGTKNLDLVVLTKIWNTPIQTKNMEDPIGTNIYTIGSSTENILLIENSCSRIKIQNSKWITEILDSRSLRELAEIVELVTIGQILDSKYLVADSSIVKSIVNVVDGKSMDESLTRLLESISIFCLFVETISNEKERKKRISEPMSSFNNTFF